MTIKEILIFASKSNNGGYDALMKSLLAKDLKPTKARIRYLLSEKHLEGETRSGGRLSITDKGQIYLDMLITDDELRRKQYCHDWKIALSSALAGALLSEPVWTLIKQAITALQTFRS